MLHLFISVIVGLFKLHGNRMCASLFVLQCFIIGRNLRTAGASIFRFNYDAIQSDAAFLDKVVKVACGVQYDLIAEFRCPVPGNQQDVPLSV